MKSKFILTAFFCVCGIMPMAAQWQRTPTPNDTLQSIKVLSDGRIALNIYAPQAKKVDIEGDIIPWGKKPDVMKSVSGVWTVTVTPVKLHQALLWSLPLPLYSRWCESVRSQVSRGT